MKNYFVFAILATLLTEDPAPPRTDLGTVEGIVARPGTLEPMAGAVVSLENLGGSVVLGTAVTLKATADSSGHFVIPNVPADTYRIYVGASADIRPEQGGGPRVVTLRAGQHITDLELFRVRAAVISGKLVDANGVPLTGVPVRAVRWNYRGGQGLLQQAFIVGSVPTTDDRGQFRILVPPGEYFIQTNPFVFSRNVAPTYFPGTTDLAKATAIPVKAGDEINTINFTNQNASRFRIAGTIYRGSTPVRGARVQLFPAGPGAASGTEVASSTLTTTDNGAFEIQGLQPGTYDLFATTRGVADSSGRLDRSLNIVAISTSSDMGRLRIEVHDRDLEQLTVNAEPEFPVTGRIVMTGDTSRRLDALATIFLQTEDIPFGLTGGLFQQPDSSLTFNMPHVPQARYAVHIDKLPEDAYISDVLAGSTSVLVSGLIVGNAKPDPLQVIVKTPGGVIEGDVRDAGKGIAYTTVVLVPAPDLRWNLDLQKTATSDRAGHFTFRGVRPGGYKVFAWTHSPIALADGTAELGAEFIARFENLGSAVTVGEAGHIENVRVTLIP